MSARKAPLVGDPAGAKVAWTTVWLCRRCSCGAHNLMQGCAQCCRPWQDLQAALPWTGVAQAQELRSSIQELWERHSSDDLVSMLLVLIDAYVTKVCTLPCSCRCPRGPCKAHTRSRAASCQRIFLIC